MSTWNSLSEHPRARTFAVAGIAGLLALLTIVAVVHRRSNEEAAATSTSSTLAVTVQTLHTMDVARSIVANGTIQSWQEIVVGPEVGGYRVAAVNVDVGDAVRRGQELVRLSDDLLKAEVASKRANVEQARATLENAAAAFRRAESLSASGALSASDLDRLRSEELAARARVAVAEAELDAADLRLRHTKVTAPDDGVISARNVNVGQVAQVGNEMLHLLRKGRVEWRAEIPEARMREVAVGQRVQLAMADGTQIEGVVRTISPTVDDSTRSGLVYVDLPAGANARPGMFARGNIVVQRSPARLAPLASIVIQDGYNYVFVVGADQAVSRRQVATGIIDGSAIEIVSGVEANERIVVKGAGFLKDGDRVNIVADESPQPALTRTEQTS